MSRTRDLGKIISGNFDVPAASLDAALRSRNLVINGKCSVNQRGTNSGVNSVLGPDRFYIHSTSAGGNVVESSSQNDGPPGFDTCFQYRTSTAITTSSADQYTGFAHRFEVQDIIPYIWSGASHVTASFWAKSSIAGTFTFNINPEEATGGGSADRILYESTYTINSTNTWEYKTITIPLSFLSSYALLSSPTYNDTGLELTWVMDVTSGGNRTNIASGWNAPASEARNLVTSTAGDTGFFTTVNSTFRITGIQFEVGDTATPFEHRSYGDELARCLRYYSVIKTVSAHPVWVYSSTGWSTTYPHPTTMRAVPSVSFTGVPVNGSGLGTSDGKFSMYSNNSWRGLTSISASQVSSSVDMSRIDGVTNDSMTPGHSAGLYMGSNCSINMDAEM